ncbi:uncharacterized protein METZ01_LOCUS225972 [marine metagenome]|uniref:Uncharacterized protein n=1 Tax=marine metagenome TaxID=408172 RepID=A0A382GD26_9ZZZZ
MPTISPFYWGGKSPSRSAASRSPQVGIFAMFRPFYPETTTAGFWSILGLFKTFGAGGRLGDSNYFMLSLEFARYEVLIPTRHGRGLMYVPTDLS